MLSKEMGATGILMLATMGGAAALPAASAAVGVLGISPSGEAAVGVTGAALTDGAVVGVAGVGGMVLPWLANPGPQGGAPSGGGGAVPAPRTPADILTPGGSPVGRPGAPRGIRRLDGGLDAAQEMFEELAASGKDLTAPRYPGKLVELPGGGKVGLRPVSSSGDKSPSIDIDIPGIPVRKIHFEP